MAPDLVTSEEVAPPAGLAVGPANWRVVAGSVITILTVYVRHEAGWPLNAVSRWLGARAGSRARSSKAERNRFRPGSSNAPPLIAIVERQPVRSVQASQPVVP